MKFRIRNNRGFSLPTIIGLGVIAGIWMLGTAALVIPAAGRISAERAKDVSRSSAEACLDYAVSRMNSNTVGWLASSGRTSLSVPSSVLAASNYTATVNVDNVPCPNNSYLYDQTIDPQYPNASVPQGGNGWRIVTATVQPQNNPAAARTVRVIMKPIYVQNVGQGDPQSMFKFAAFGVADVGGVGNMHTDSFDSALAGGHPAAFQDKDGDLGTNKMARLTGNAHVGGDVVIATPQGNSGSVFSTSGSNWSVSEKIIGNGAEISANSSNPQYQAYDGDPVKLPPAPTAPSGATDLGSINLSGNKTLTLTAGNYIVSSISISGNGQLNINSTNGPVNIYVQGAGSSAGISITGNGISNAGLPEKLRIWYGGTGETKVAGNGNFTGVVYAPNSAVKIAGNGEVFGAVVGNTVAFNGNGNFHYDRALGRSQEFMYIPPQNVKVVRNWQAVSWDEM